jgi:hypothetical protein
VKIDLFHHDAILVHETKYKEVLCISKPPSFDVSNECMVSPDDRCGSHLQREFQEFRILLEGMGVS